MAGRRGGDRRRGGAEKLVIHDHRAVAGRGGRRGFVVDDVTGSVGAHYATPAATRPAATAAFLAAGPGTIVVTRLDD